MIFVATKIVSDHIATVAVSTTASEIRWDRLMPQLQVGPDARAGDGPATLACPSLGVKSGVGWVGLEPTTLHGTCSPM